MDIPLDHKLTFNRINRYLSEKIKDRLGSDWESIDLFYYNLVGESVF